MALSVPFTTLTDYALAAVGFGFAVAMRRRIGPRNRVSGWFWCAAFVASAIAAAAGGTFHGFDTRLEPAALRRLWNLAMASMGACGAFMTAGIHAAYIRREEGTIAWLACGIAVTLLGAAVQHGAVSTLAAWNRNGAYHLIQIAGLYCFYRCARTVRDRPGVTRT